jgi:DNA-binding NtrC family response regulator
MLQLLERIVLDRTPYTFCAAPSSLDVPRLLAESEFDVIIADVRMPGLDGLAILELVRAEGRFEEVVLITAFGDAESSARALERGAFDYITKPFKREQLLWAVERAMRSVALKREAHALRAVYELEPFSRAEHAFAREYVRRLAARTGASPAALAEQTGMAPELIAEMLRGETGGEAAGRDQ